MAIVSKRMNSPLPFTRTHNKGKDISPNWPQSRRRPRWNSHLGEGKGGVERKWKTEWRWPGWKRKTERRIGMLKQDEGEARTREIMEVKRIRKERRRHREERKEGEEKRKEKGNEWAYVSVVSVHILTHIKGPYVQFAPTNPTHLRFRPTWKYSKSRKRPQWHTNVAIPEDHAGMALRLACGAIQKGIYRNIPNSISDILFWSAHEYILYCKTR